MRCLFFGFLVMLALGLLAADPDRIIALPTAARVVELSAEAETLAWDAAEMRLEVVTAEDAVPSVRFAADELCRYIQACSGHEVARATVPTPGRVSLILGDNRFSREAGLQTEGLPRDGFIIRSRMQCYYLLGQDEPGRDPVKAFSWSVFFERGTLNATYDFLERFLGIRFYFPGEIGTIVPSLRELRLPQVNLVDRPDFPRRRIGPAPHPLQAWFPEQEYAPVLVGRMNMTWRTESFYVPCCHSMERLEIAKRFGNDHPEVLAMDETGQRHNAPGSVYYGNLCYSSRFMRDELYKDAVAFLRGELPAARGMSRWDPSALQTGFFNIMPKDHFRTCYCPDCKAFYSQHPESELVWDLVADIAGRLKADGIPGYVTSMGYGHYPDPPKTVTLPDNVLIMISVRGPWAENIPAARQEHDQRIQAWTAFTGRKPWLWTAVYKYGGLELPDIPATTPRVIGRYFVRQANAISGTFMESESDHWIFSYLNYYVMARCSWNTGSDPDALVEEHHRLMFAAGAPPMQRFFDRIEELWLTRISGRIVETRLGSEAIPPTDTELWENIYAPAELASFDQCFDEAEKLTAGDPLASRRVTYFRRHFLGQVRRGAERYFRNRESVRDWQAAAVKLAPEQKITIDGQLDDAPWQEGTPLFLLPMAGESETAEVETRVHLRFDDTQLFLAAFCEEPQMAAIAANFTDKDHPSLWTDQVFEIFINPSGDGKEYFHWIINSAGTVYDAKATRVDTQSRHDPTWDAGATIKTRRGDDHWTLEMAIPLAAIAPLQREAMRVNFGRFRVLSTGVGVRLYTWSPFIKGFHDLESFGSLRLADAAPATTNLANNGDFSAAQQRASFGNWHSGRPAAVPPNGDIIRLDRRVFRTGGQALRITSDGKENYGVTQYLPQLKPNTTYRITLQMKTENIVPNGKWGGALVNYGDVRNHWYPTTPFNGTLNWTRQGFVFKTGPETNQDPKRQAWIRLAIYSATGTAWFDDIKVVEVNE